MTGYAAAGRSRNLRSLTAHAATKTNHVPLDQTEFSLCGGGNRHIVDHHMSPGRAQQATDEPLFYHTVRFELRDDADSAALERVLGMMRALGEKLDVVERCAVGPDLSEEFDIGDSSLPKADAI